jgi:hypothetical protein
MVDRARHDVNLVPTLSAVSNADGETPVSLWANPTKHTLLGFDLVPGVDYDYIDVQQTSATVETYVFKTGGAGGTTIRTIVVTYTDATKANIDTVVYS